MLVGIIDFNFFLLRVQIKFTFKERSELRYVDVYRYVVKFYSANCRENFQGR